MKKTEKLTASIPVELMAQVKAKALKDNRNLSNMVAVLLEKGLKK